MDVAREVLQDLLSKPGLWFDSVCVGKRLAPMHTEPETVAERARLEERLFAAWDGYRFQFPAFQFGPDGSPLEATVALIQVLPRDRDGKVGLDAALWVYAPDAALDDLTPAEIFLSDPSRVVLLARRRLHGSDSDD
jgi:hypothetical protein